MLKDALGVDAELKVGSMGQFTVSVDGAPVIEKGAAGFPTEQQIVDAVRQKLGS